MKVDIINGESKGISHSSTCEFNSIECLYVDRKGRVVDVVIRRSNCLDELVIEMNVTCAAGVLCALSACPLVWKSKIYHWFRKVIRNYLKSMGGVFSIKTIDGQLRVVSPLDSEHHISLGKDRLLSNKFMSVIEGRICWCCFFDLVKTIVVLFVWLKDIDLINLINQDVVFSIILIKDLEVNYIGRVVIVQDSVLLHIGEDV